MADVELENMWSAAFPDRSRPQIYSTTQSDERFQALTEVDDFLVDSLQSLTPAQLYALTANNYEVLVALQEEHTALEKIASKLKNRDLLAASIKDPQDLPRQEVFEERKEAALYDYKYDANRRMLPARFTVSENVSEQEKFDCREPQEPFAQSGLVPNDKQYRSLMATAKAEGHERNPDNQKPYQENFAFEARSSGTWIAKMLQPEAPSPPRTRAREAALSATNANLVPSDRTSRFNGEKIPPTRDISIAPSETTSPTKRVATPTATSSPAPKRRKIETVDLTNGLPKKKHANQYTKKRELEMAGQLAAAQEYARANNLPVPEHYTQLEAMSARGSPMPTKKKHPNQYTKRREREEAERRAREKEDTDRLPQVVPPPPPVVQPPPPTPQAYNYGWPERGNLPPPPPMPVYQPPALQRYGSSLPYDPVHSARQTIAPSGPPNPYSLDREHSDRGTSFYPQHQASHQRFPSFWDNQPPRREPEPHYPRYDQQPPEWNQASQPAHNLNQPVPGPVPLPEQKAVRVNSPAINNSLKPMRDTSHMTREEKRHFVFKDHELIIELNKDHSWLHDDIVKADAWKSKIQNSDYPVRTWAMLRKWREWREEGKDKRPRDKDGNRIRNPAFSPGVDETPPLEEDVDMADAVSVGPSQRASRPASRATSAKPSTTAAVNDPGARALSPLRTSSRLRTRIGVESPVMPSSPLVNGFSARDLDTDSKNTPSLSFSKLQDMRELDANAKVDTWQEKTQTDYAASKMSGKGALRQHPNLRNHGTEDELYPSSTDQELEQEHEIEHEEVGQRDEEVQAPVVTPKLEELDQELKDVDAQDQPINEVDKVETSPDSEHTSLGTEFQEHDHRRTEFDGTDVNEGVQPELDTKEEQHTHVQPQYSEPERFEDLNSEAADDCAEQQHSEAPEDIESEDPLHGSVDNNSPPSSPSTDPGERDTTYRSGIRTRRPLGEPMRRTRSGVSSVSGRPRRSRTAQKTQSKTTESDAEDPISPTTRRTRGFVVIGNYSEESEGSEIVVASPVIGKRSLRPNPPKRTLTVDSEVSTSVGTRRSTRHSGRVDGL